ncbi:TetR/AcrR family transcriptional regulator [Halioxenophilus sp. WMMB6]|uniref:TetR/AcrR family transcriptional regulator n=1 Tax=Halioxenophilus sp. WMMB6 TaxID=3073815 RepID=UPI00295ECBBB|nr:TetR/AcrR family transcriptional regulator [Halioxenophilus sp. WMMB6]
MGKRASNTQERILATAEQIILCKGFSGTSIDEIIDKAAITKGGFFYHFEGKVDLARRLILRYLEQDAKLFGDLFEQADQLSEDPLQQLLIFLKLFANAIERLEETHPGCLVAGLTYENQQFDEEIRELIRAGVTSWRELILRRLEAVAKQRPSKLAVELTELADMFTTCTEGGLLLARIFNDNRHIVTQLLNYRTHLRLLFE